MENKELMQMFSSLLDEKLQPLNERMERLEGGQQVIIEKLDNVSKQVASNTEKQSKKEYKAGKGMTTSELIESLSEKDFE